MPDYKLLYLTSLVTFTFGGLTFSILALYYWRERARRKGGQVFATFTAFCAAAFLVNLLLEIAAARSPESRSAAGLALALEFVTSLLPPLLAHVIYSEESERLPWRYTWLGALCVFYGTAILSAAGRVARDSGRIVADWTDSLDSIPAVMLAAAGVMGLLLQIVSRRTLTPVAQSRRFWTRVLLCLTILVSAINIVRPDPFVSLLPDYLVLGFFCVTVYYSERLVFFDFLIKRGLFFALALVGLTSFFAIGPEVMAWFPDDWSRPWIGALLLMPFWMMGPRIYGLVGRFIDRVCLRRRYTPANAERQFIQDIQAAATEDDLRLQAAESLCGVFQTRAEVHVVPFQDTRDDREDGLVAELDRNGARLGCVTLDARPDAIPFLSDDRRLLQSLARTLSVVLENVRFREQRRQQEEREQQLRLLTSRAELKALRAQINPHFLFNALNAIAGLIQDQPQLADETVEQLAHVFRYTLRKSQTEWVRLDEELEFVRSYLRVEQARFGERLQVEFDVDPALSAIPIPTMTIQPLVENAVKHGVSLQGSGRVVVRARLDDEALRIEVCDDGPGFPAGFSLSESTAGHSLRNVSERIGGYYDAAAPVRWENGPFGTRVSLTIPGVLAPAFAGSIETCAS